MGADPLNLETGDETHNVSTGVLELQTAAQPLAAADALAQLAAEALAEHRAGKTHALDPDRL